MPITHIWYQLTIMMAAGLSLVTFHSEWSHAVEPASIVFHNAAAQVGIDFHHHNSMSPKKYMPETIGAGAVFFDFNRDGWVDIFLIDSGSLTESQGAQPARSALYQNQGRGVFIDVTEQSRIAQHGYGMGACAADIDNDGWIDLYLTQFGPNALYRNNGDGTFTDITARAGVGSSLWGSSCAFGDLDKDGDVDLVVGNYLDFSLENNKFCGDHVQQRRRYCHPNVYLGLPNTLYRNNGDGAFTDITQEAGLQEPSAATLGVVLGDYDNDGWIDIYVANDSVPNALYRNLGNGRFEETGLLAGVAVNHSGLAEAGMGTDFGDFDRDGLLDVFVTNLDEETNTLYRNMGDGLFIDVTSETGHGEPSMRYVGWGTAFFDYDNDADLDVIVANGHFMDNPAAFRRNSTYAQRNLLFENQDGGLFKEVGRHARDGLALEKVSRGLAVGDIDNDGDLDVLINNSGQTADLLRNDGGPHGHAILVRLIGAQSNRDGIGARLRLSTGGITQIAEIKAGSSYLGQHDMRAHFGLGTATRIDRLEVHWPSGAVDAMTNIAADHILTIREGQGIIQRQAFQKAP